MTWHCEFTDRMKVVACFETYHLRITVIFYTSWLVLNFLFVKKN